MKADELRQKSIDELKRTLEKQRIDVEKLMLDIIQKKEKNFVKAKTLRADIARVNTIISEKKIIGQAQNAQEQIKQEAK
jgi:ribosomal protein L29